MRIDAEVDTPKSLHVLAKADEDLIFNWSANHGRIIN